MQLSQAISLIHHSVPEEKTRWADLGCGDGLFTNALSKLLVEDSLIYAVDKNKQALKNVSVENEIQLEKLELDFVKDALTFTDLTAILMANAFHFVKDKHRFINKIFNCLDPNGYLIVVEYNTDVVNPWVPYPISFKELQLLFARYNYTVRKLNEINSRYNGVMYSALISKNK